MRCIIAIDPGANGGIAIKTEEGDMRCHKMPSSATELASLLKTYEDCRPLVFVEKVNVRRDDFESKGRVFRTIKMNNNVQSIRTTLELVGYQYCMVHPRTWQAKLHLMRKGESYADRKRRFKDVASQIYDIKTNLWNADALLILAFGQLMLDIGEKWIKKNINGSNY